ncbi:RING/U-box superfamily protein [Prunus dulcis]|uniref:RING/U-box superfamily protein n=1 Tax=Prunus dulcis TaxID=3755 RepID=A0A4Y1R0H2_PRUDU|nr:RING/U-box superfamily protein [Prunus dulcis]
MVNCNAFSKTICSLCYKDFDPIVEDLQVISICGHVYHELCLQERFGYFSSKKKYSCPVCKQSCKPNDVARLYFQWGDSSLTQRPVIEREEDSEALRREVRRLEAMALGLGSALERKEKEVKALNQEVKKEVELKNEALKQQTSMQQLLHMKSKEFDKLTLECLRLQERNRALDKELAAVELVSDLDLDEEDVLKIAALGNGADNKDTIDVLRTSLVMSNRNYKELMAKYNLLEQKEARHSKKLEKARGKINKLKTKVQELETAVEVKNTEVLRALKASKKTRGGGFIQHGVNQAASDRKKETSVLGLSNLVEALGSITGTCADTAKTPAADIADVVIIDDDEQVQPMMNIRNESPIPQQLPRPGDACFSGGLLGPDGTNRMKKENSPGTKR